MLKRSARQRFLQQSLKLCDARARVLGDYGRAKYNEFVELEQATRLFEQALAVEPQSVDTLLWLADLYAMGYGRGYAAAAELYRRLLQLDPRAVDAHIGLGMLHRAPGVSIRFDDALALFRKAPSWIHLGPTHTSTWRRHC